MARQTMLSTRKPKGRAGSRLRKSTAVRAVPNAAVYTLDAVERIAMARSGVSPAVLGSIAKDMAIPKDKLYQTIGVARASVSRKLREHKLLSQDESERVLGIARLVGLADTLVRESGEPEGFDAAKWVAGWLDRPLPALGGKRPAEFMDTAEGRTLVYDLIGQMRSAAYA